MGFFDFFRKAKQVKNGMAAGGNFGFIAQNMACIYYVVDNHPLTKDLPSQNKLYATALFDLIAYLMDGSMDINMIAAGVRAAYHGDIRIGFTTRSHSTMFGVGGNSEYPRLVNTTMQVESMIFMLSNPEFGVDRIIDSVIENKEVIEQMVDKTMAEGDKCNLYNNVFQNVNGYLREESILEIIKQFDLYSL